MAVELELEKTYLARAIPAGLDQAPSKIISDNYILATVDGQVVHPVLRIRRKGEKYEITKKQPIDGADLSKQTEHTIRLDAGEYAVLKDVPGRSSTKRRYYLEIAGVPAEVDVYLEQLAGLVIIDFEFASEEARDSFEMPKICLAEITQDETLAGGMLAGKSFEDIRPQLEKYGYKALKVGE